MHTSSDVWALSRVIIIAVTATMFALPSQAKVDMIPAPYDHEYLTVHSDERAKTADNIATLGKIFEAIFANDWVAMGNLYADNYVQHNPDMRDGKEGVIELFKSLDFSKLVYETTMQIAEGPYVIAMSKLQFAPEQPMLAVVDINFVRDGLSREHWDIIMPASAPNKSGRTLFDSVYDESPKVSQRKRDKNRVLVANMINDVINQKKVDEIDKYFAKKYYPHIEGADGKQSVIDYLERFPDIEVDIKRIVTQSDLVLAHSRITKAGKDYSRVDIYRVRSNKLVEHWGVEQEVPEKMLHNNGMF